VVANNKEKRKASMGEIKQRTLHKRVTDHKFITLEQAKVFSEDGSSCKGDDDLWWSVYFACAIKF
jgi:hypothetical protein